MPSEDYTAVTPGGLKLKGVNGSKISKPSKKRRKPNPEALPKHSADDGADSEGAVGKHNGVISTTKDEPSTEQAEERDGGEDMGEQHGGKTEAELRHEERRRRRVCPSSHDVWKPTC